jgi:hypothetical protein
MMARGSSRALSETRGLIWFIWSIWFNQTNETDQINKRDMPVRGLLAPRATAYGRAGAVAADWHGIGSKKYAYFTLEKSATILASCPS